MKNKQKFLRGELVQLKGQTQSPKMTINKILREFEETEEGEKLINFSYQCEFWNAKKSKFETYIFDQESIKRYQKPREKSLKLSQI
jgi:hypothetical protein